MAAFEIGTAYVALVPSAEGIAAKLSQELVGPAEKAGDEAGEKAGKSFAAKLTSHVADAAKGIGLVGGGLLAKGFVDSMSNEVSNDKLAAQLGLPPEMAAELGKVAGKIYAGNYGESLGEVNQALQQVLQNGLLPEDATNEQLQSITTKALNVASAFDQDLGGAARAAGQLVKTGLAANADEAFDIITRGFQQGADKSGDFLDTLNEYGTQFRKLGINGTTATGLISQGLKAGARDGDVVADALKEFSIRAIDGSEATTTAFQLLGFNAKEAQDNIAKGGESAKTTLSQVLVALRAQTDPATQAAAAVGLFGTQAEDLGAALFALDPTTAARSMGTVAGAAEQMGNTLGDNTAGKIETFRRMVETKFADVASAAGPILSVAPGIAAVFSTFGNLSGPLKALGGAAGSAASGLLSGAKAAATFAGNTLTTVANIGKQTAALVASKAAAAAQAIATGAVTAAQWLLNAAMAANPITLVVIAIAALVAAFVLAYTKIEPFRNAVNAVAGAIKDFVTGAVDFLIDHWQLLLGILLGPIGIVVGLLITHFGTIKDAVTGMVEWVGGKIEAFVTFFVELPGKIISAVGDFAGLLVSKGTDLIQGLINGYMSILGSVTGFFTSLGGTIINWIGDAASFLFNKGRDIIQGLQNGISSFFESVFRGWFKIGDWIKDAVGDAASFLVDIGGDIVNGLIEGIKNTWHRVTDTLGDLAGHLPGIAKKVLGIGSPSKVFAEIGVNTMQGFQVGIENEFKNVAGSLTSRMNDLAGAGTNLIGNVNIGTNSTVQSATTGLSGATFNNVFNQVGADPTAITREISWLALTQRG